MFVLNIADKKVYYDKKYIYIDGNIYAFYKRTKVIRFSDYLVLAEFYHHKDSSWLLAKKIGHGILEAYDCNNILFDTSHKRIVATFNGPHGGALASYIAYRHYIDVSNAQHKHNTKKEECCYEEYSVYNSHKYVQEYINNDLTPQLPLKSSKGSDKNNTITNILLSITILLSIIIIKLILKVSKNLPLHFIKINIGIYILTICCIISLTQKKS